MGLMPPVVNKSATQEVDMNDLMKDAKQLMEKKDKIEEELRELDNQLVAAGIGMNEPLVDQAGFPRSEIDIHSIRISRNLVIRLRNDHKAVMVDIENILGRIHEAKRLERQQQQAQEQQGTGSMAEESNTSSNSTQQQQTSIEQDTTMTEVPVPFAIIDAIAPDSPAYIGGLRRNDQILQFGHLDNSNHQRLQALNALISQSESQPVSITLLREGNTIQVTVTPRSGWGGRGTLGCHLLPL